jgi:hypothetical protein
MRNHARRSSVSFPVVASLAFLMAAAVACGSVNSSPGDAGGGGGSGGTIGAGGSSGGAGNQGGGGANVDAAQETAPPTVEQACTMMAEALCGRFANCAPVAVPLFYGDMATCLQRAKLGCTKEQEVTDIARTTGDIVACADAAGRATCDDLLANNFPAACQPKPGARIDGEGCGSSLQCASTHCEKPAMDCGLCAPRHPVNGDCTSDDGCVSGLVCANKKCVMPGALGAGCSDNQPCRGNLYCSTSTKVCAQRAGAGTACGGDPGICDLFHGAGCNIFAIQANQKCETLTVAAGGRPCGILNGALTFCVQGNMCAGASLASPGVCASPAGDGETCDNNVHCLPPANCVGGRCRLPSVGSCPK